MALIFNAQTGQYVDDGKGADASLNGQSQRNLGVSNDLYSQLGQYSQGFQQAQEGQNQLGSYLNRVINGGAPSVAAGQLQQGLGQIQSGIQSQASGATGNNAALANYNATQAYADAAAKANQAAAAQRAQEIATATAQKGQLLGQQGNQTANMFGNVVQGANQASGIAAQTGETQAQIDQKNKELWMNFAGNLINAGGAAATKFAAG